MRILEGEDIQNAGEYVDPKSSHHEKMVETVTKELGANSLITGLDDMAGAIGLRSKTLHILLDGKRIAPRISGPLISQITQNRIIDFRIIREICGPYFPKALRTRSGVIGSSSTQTPRHYVPRGQSLQDKVATSSAIPTSRKGHSHSGFHQIVFTDPRSWMVAIL